MVASDQTPIVDYERLQPRARKVCDPPPKLTKGHWIVIAAMLLLPICAIVNLIITDDLAEYRFVVPLIGRYFVQRFDQGNQSNPQYEKQLGPYQVFLLNQGGTLDWEPEHEGPDNAKPTSRFVPEVQRIAIIPGQPIIIGTRRTDFFVLDAKNRNLQLFGSAAEFNAAVRGLGANPVPLMDPTVMAKSLPRSTIRPWAYQQMNGLLGLSDVAWSSITQDVGGIIALAGGLAIPRVYRWKTKWMRRTIVFVFAAGLGTAVNIFANGWMLGSGPDAFVGSVILPIGYVITAVLSGCVPIWACRILSSLLPKKKDTVLHVADAMS